HSHNNMDMGRRPEIRTRCQLTRLPEISAPKRMQNQSPRAPLTLISSFVLPPPTLAIEHRLRRRVARDYSLPETDAYFGYPVTQISGPIFSNFTRSSRAASKVDPAPSA